MLSGNIFITGGAGTLGRAIMAQAAREKWAARFTVYSRSELLQSTVRACFPQAHYILGDVRDAERLAAAVEGHDIVIHAAAMKRIPEAEAQPYECWQTNVVGAHNVARACINARVERCIGISTDKACEATTMYGASKLAMEKIFRSQPHGGCVFTLVRYGNVIASRGSVIPIWRKQFGEGIPLQITDPAMTRFWMGPFDAVDLIVQAAQACHAQVIVKKMKAASLLELATMVCGQTQPPYRVSGLRSEEKHHEDLVHVNECAIEEPNRFVLDAGGALGLYYSSDRALRLTTQDFESMLRQAESLEKL